MRLPVVVVVCLVTAFWFWVEGICY